MHEVDGVLPSSKPSHGYAGTLSKQLLTESIWKSSYPFRIAVEKLEIYYHLNIRIRTDIIYVLVRKSYIYNPGPFPVFPT